MNDVTRILSAIEQGDPHAAEQLLPLDYDELRKLTAQKLAKEKPGQTLEATALVHEAYLKLLGPSPEPVWNGRVHFSAAEAKRRILIDHARRKHRARRGGVPQVPREIRPAVPGVVLAAAVYGGFMWNIGPAFSTAGALLAWSLCGRFGAVR
jgi:RNA polymerase sigma factor (TIGR02999 family)